MLTTKEHWDFPGNLSLKSHSFHWMSVMTDLQQALGPWANLLARLGRVRPTTAHPGASSVTVALWDRCGRHSPSSIFYAAGPPGTLLTTQMPNSCSVYKISLFTWLPFKISIRSYGAEWKGTGAHVKCLESWPQISYVINCVILRNFTSLNKTYKGSAWD